MVADAMSKQLAMAALSWCDQLEQALLDNDQATIDAIQLKLLKHFALAEEKELRVAIECVRARASEVLAAPEEEEEE